MARKPGYLTQIDLGKGMRSCSPDSLGGRSESGHCAVHRNVGDLNLIGFFIMRHMISCMSAIFMFLLFFTDDDQVDQADPITSTIVVVHA